MWHIGVLPQGLTKACHIISVNIYSPTFAFALCVACRLAEILGF